MLAMRTRRAKAEYLGKSAVRFTCCDCGHQWRKTIKSKVRGRGALPPSSVEFLARHWNANGAIVKCPACEANRRTP